MHKRPLNSRFNRPVIRGTKVTTIRDKPWPIGKPIMLYNWTGAAYRSKQSDVAVVIVEKTEPVTIFHRRDGGLKVCPTGKKELVELWRSEGFSTKAEFEVWFKRLVKPGKRVEKHLMSFRLLSAVVGRSSSLIRDFAPQDGREWECQCARCGSSTEWVDCPGCGGEGVTGHNCGEDCCACFDPEDNVICGTCNGHGGWWQCISDAEWCEGNPRRGYEQYTRGEIEWFLLPQNSEEGKG